MTSVGQAQTGSPPERLPAPGEYPAGTPTYHSARALTEPGRLAALASCGGMRGGAPAQLAAFGCLLDEAFGRLREPGV